MTRRTFLMRAAAASAAVGLPAAAYPVLEARWLQHTMTRVAVPNLPPAFAGARVVYLADLHHGRFTPRSYLIEVIERANALKPDLVLLGGDYVAGRDARYLAPCLEMLGSLRARWGRFAVLGNHDHWTDAAIARDGLARAGIEAIDNRGVWVERGGDRLRVCGVGDLWADAQDLDAALGDATPRDASLLLSHNPDFVESIRDPRVGLAFSGHTHGGQVHLPGFEPRWAPTRYGMKYLRGLCHGPTTRVFVTSGVGTTGPPVRLGCRPEIVAMTLVPGPKSA
jgi:predicted MPP superfamily phosphohydrolase